MILVLKGSNKQDCSLCDVSISSTDNRTTPDLLQNMVVRIHLPSGVRKRFRVALGTSVEQLLVKVCSSEGLSCRHHSLQYVDFKHKFLDLSSVVAEIGVDEIRLMDKTGVIPPPPARDTIALRKPPCK